jgi:hypothetical protein
MFRTVLPLIDRNRLITRPSRICQLRTGHLALINPARPVMSSRPVCKLLIRGKYLLRETWIADFRGEWFVFIGVNFPQPFIFTTETGEWIDLPEIF